MFTRKEFAEWASVALVVLSGAMAGHYAEGMNSCSGPAWRARCWAR